MLKFRPRITLLFALLAPLALHVGQAQAVTYDAVADFQTSSNPNGVWSYLGGTPISSTLMTTTGTTAGSNLPQWSDQISGFPNQAYITANNTGTAAGNSCCGSIVYPAHSLQLDGQALGAIVRFTAQTSGIYAINGLFESGDTSMTTHDVAVIENGSTSLIATQALVNGNTVPFALSGLSLAANDYIDFVSYGFAGGSFGGTALQATVSTVSAAAVPEPTSMAILLGALLLMSAMVVRGAHRQR